MKQVGNTILAKGGNHILAKRDNSAWPKGSKLSGFSNHQQAKKYYDLLISEPKPIMEDWMNAGHVYYILNETEKSIEYYRKAQELCDSHDEFVRLYQIDKKDLIKQGANEVDLFILPDELI